ncbi:MAG TPA: STING domain-containing protein [Puia sp.]|nr:STING domain-containing protein [Puia sp.]
MFSSQKIKSCFIIGPMRDMPRLIAFRDHIIKPILEPLGFHVNTPESGDIGNVMRQVLLRLEQADILIADITGNNPNVLYELGVYHSFGKPYVVIKEDIGEADVTATPFDIAEYRFHLVNFSKPAEASQKLTPLLTGIIDRIDTTDWFGNPVTDFYDSPIAEIPTAIGLFKNYRKNFIDILAPRVFQKNDNNDFEAVSMEILVPAKLNMTTHTYIGGLKNAGLLDLQTGSLTTKTRPFSFNFRVDENGGKVIVDIPTILSTLNESITQRRKSQQRYFSDVEWEVLEQQELERFSGKCESHVQKLEETYPECTGKITIVWGWTPQRL